MTEITPWGEGGSVRDARYIQPAISRRRCTCGCGQRITHAGMANGVCLMQGCELSVRRWVRNPADSLRRRGPIMNQRAWSALWLAKIMLDTGRFPSFDDIRNVVGLRSAAGAARIVNNLVTLGLIERGASGELPAVTETGRAALAEQARR